MTPSNLDVVPDAALPHVQWAYDLVVERRIRQADLLPELNRRLQEVGVAPVSRSALNRWAIRIHNGERGRPGRLHLRPASPAALVISAESRSLFAAALRSIADDIEGSGR